MPADAAPAPRPAATALCGGDGRLAARQLSYKPTTRQLCTSLPRAESLTAGRAAILAARLISSQPHLSATATACRLTLCGATCGSWRGRRA